MQVNLTYMAVIAAVGVLAVQTYGWRSWARVAAGLGCLACMLVFLLLLPSPSRSLAAILAKQGATGLLDPSVLAGHSERCMLPGISDLASLGMRNLDEKREVQLWIREHSAVDSIIAPPLGNWGGWQIFSQRASVMWPSFFAYTSFSRQLALDFARYMERHPKKFNLSWSDSVRVGIAEGGNLILVDDEIQVRQPGDPPALFSSGRYHVLQGQPTSTVQANPIARK
jgi:hypothetical protein